MKTNTITKGTESLIVGGKLSYLPTNEDYCIIVEITDIEDGIVTGKKIWDLATVPQSFVAALYYQGSDEVPTEDVLEIGQYTVFYRVGDFASTGSGGTPPLQFEKHSQDESKVSWICFVPRNHKTIAIKYLSSSSGIKVIRDSGSWVTVGDSKTLVVLGTDTFLENDICLGIEHRDNFIVQAYKKGITEEEKTITVNGQDITLKLDASGRVITRESGCPDGLFDIYYVSVDATLSFADIWLPVPENLQDLHRDSGCISRWLSGTETYEDDNFYFSTIYVAMGNIGFPFDGKWRITYYYSGYIKSTSTSVLVSLRFVKDVSANPIGTYTMDYYSIQRGGIYGTATGTAEIS